jgi:hypothetical protein
MMLTSDHDEMLPLVAAIAVTTMASSEIAAIK